MDKYSNALEVVGNIEVNIPVIDSQLLKAKDFYPAEFEALKEAVGRYVFLDKFVNTGRIVKVVEERNELREENQILKDGVKALRMLTGFDISCKEHPTKQRELLIPRALKNPKETLIETIAQDMVLMQYILSIYYSVDKIAMQKETTEDVYDKIKAMLEVLKND